jgi:hypothetical protein
MPGSGRYEIRERTDHENEPLTDEQRDLLGSEVLDVYLNDDVYWSGVPEAAWDTFIGGFQVLRKWLSYREERIVGRPLGVQEARTFTNVARRLTELALLGPRLDANYIAATESPHQERLPELA